MPARPATSHAWQGAWQALLQQKPSTHWRLAHSGAVWQRAPFARPLTHAPPSQYGLAVVPHWLSEVHVDRHAVPPGLQTRSPHDVVAGLGQLPAPLQPARAVNVAPAQLAARHVVSSPGYVHAVGDAAVHAPAHAPLPVHAPRVPCGWPDVTCVQVPRAAPVSQALHRSVQASLQQTPSTQCCDAHSDACAQVDPLAFGPHDPPVQLLGARHCALELQEAKQAVLPLQA
jgi:hypothetical protein